MNERQHRKDSRFPLHGRRFRLWRRYRRARDGATAIEFALLAIPYFLIVFAIFETFIAFTGEQLVSYAVDSMGKKLRTGQITYGLGLDTDKTETEFRRLFCDEISILIQCSAEEIATPSKLYLDIRSFNSFADIPRTVALIEEDGNIDLDRKDFTFAPGGASTINMFRAYYRWQVITDLVRPYLSNIHSASGSYFLIVATTAFQNEAYPE